MLGQHVQEEWSSLVGASALIVWLLTGEAGVPRGDPETAAASCAAGMEITTMWFLQERSYSFIKLGIPFRISTISKIFAMFSELLLTFNCVSFISLKTVGHFYLSSCWVRYYWYKVLVIHTWVTHFWCPANFLPKCLPVPPQRHDLRACKPILVVVFNVIRKVIHSLSLSHTHTYTIPVFQVI